MSRRAVAAALLLVACVVAVYGVGASTNGFAVDDHRFIVDNPFVGGEGAWWTAFTDPSTVDPENGGGIVRPLRTLEYRLDRALHGAAWFFHWHSVLWHVAAALCVFALLRRLVRDETASFFGAAVWALHPMHTESVAGISSRADVAMGACVAAALYCSVRSSGRDRWLALGLLSAAVAMLWKETAAVVPALVGVLHWLGPVGDESAAQRAHTDWRRLATTVAPWALVAGIYVVYRFSFGGESASHVTYRIGGGVVGASATMARALGAYELHALLPVRPSFDWSMSSSRGFADVAVLLWIVIHLGCVVGAVALARRGARVPLAALALFVLPLLPVANVPFDLGIPTTERFLYIPLLAVAVLASTALRYLPRCRPALAVVAACLAALSIARVTEWRDDDTLLAATLRQHTSVRAHAYFGGKLRDEGWALRSRARTADDDAERAELAAESRARFDGALQHSVAAIAAWKAQITPWPPVDHVAAVPFVSAANVSFVLGRHADALAFADEAAVIAPDLPQAHYNRAWALQRLGRGREAAGAMQTALDNEQDIGSDEGFRFFVSVARLLERDSAWEGAATAYEKALTFKPLGPAADAVRTAIGRLPR